MALTVAEFGDDPIEWGGATFGAMMKGHGSISADILARYAADAAMGVDGVRGLAGRRAVRLDTGDTLRVELHLAARWGASMPVAGQLVQERVREYLARMADVVPARVDVVFDEVGPIP